MIPKIIHYCWLSGDPFPADIQRCIDSWHKYLPDYELRLWDTKRFDIHSTLWTQQAFEHRKYAFAADYIRLFALYNEGGIYLDSDVLVYKSFDDLLQLPYFIGCDQIGAFEAAVIGAEKGCPWIADILQHYTDRPFIKADGTLDMLPLPETFHHELVNNGYVFHALHQKEDFPAGQTDADTPKQMYVFDGDFFNSRNQVVARQTPKSYCSHNYAGSWVSTKATASRKEKLKKAIPNWLANCLLEFSHKTFTRHKFDRFIIPFTKD